VIKLFSITVKLFDRSCWLLLEQVRSTFDLGFYLGPCLVETGAGHFPHGPVNHGRFSL